MPHLRAGYAGERFRFEVEGQPFLAVYLELKEPDMGIEVALPISSINAAERRLALILAGGLLVITSLGALVGIVLARRTSRRFNILAKAAARFSQGNLSSALPAEGQINEESLLAQAPERARVNLLSMLTQIERERDWTNQHLDAIVEGILTLDNQQRIIFPAVVQNGSRDGRKRCLADPATKSFAWPNPTPPSTD